MFHRMEAALVADRSLAALDPSDREASELWCAYDLAAVVESCFGRQTFPLGEASEPWLDRLGGTYLPPLPEVMADTRRLFLLDRGIRVGTLALPIGGLPGAPIVVSCLYLRPESRGRGLVSAALTALQASAVHEGHPGIQLDTHWVWQAAVRFYLRRRMWVTGWERHLSFAWVAGRGPWELHQRGDTLRLSVAGHPVAEARRDGDQLTRFHADEAVAGGTLALLMALRGWPLVREGGPHPDEKASPERLHHEIESAELRARELGWVFPR
ncbi:MAG: hypothetical protein AB8I08_37275 [Sandaracinaceae bacterium]